MNFPDPREIVLESGTSRAAVIPEICLVSDFQVGPWQVLYRPQQTGNVRRWGLPLMIPNFGRLKDGRFEEKGTDLPIHGFGRVLPWTVTHQEPDRLDLELQSSEATRASYPYEFTFLSKITLSEGKLTYLLTMHNEGNEPMPIAPGFHPYFTIGQQEKKHVRVQGLPGFDPALVNWDTQPPDTFYAFPHRIEADFPQMGRLTIEELPQDGHYSLKEIQVWSEPMEKPDHNFICLEPIVSHENALNRPADRLEIPSQQTHVIKWSITAQPT